MMGEGFKFVMAAGGIGLAGWALVEASAWVSRGWAEMIDCWPTGDKSSTPTIDARGDAAQAMVPELAAAERAPDYRGRCRCDARRRRPQEPCSDFDGG